MMNDLKPLLALVASLALSAAPSLAQASTSPDLSVGSLERCAPHEAALQRATTLSLQPSADAQVGVLRLQGTPLTRVLLLVGSPLAQQPAPLGLRLSPRSALWLELDVHGEHQVFLPPTATPAFAQLWTPPGAGAASPDGAWSDLIVAFPAGGQQDSTARPGDLVVTEFMKDPTEVSDGNGEWIELRNMLPWRLDIAGVVLSDASGASFVFDAGGGPLYLRPNESFVVGANADITSNGGVIVDWEWSGFSLRNSSDEIYLHDRFGAVMDRVEYDNGVLWPDTPGMSISLEPTSVDSLLNDDPTNWCHASSVIGAGADTGTPGELNDQCP